MPLFVMDYYCDDRTFPDGVRSSTLVLTANIEEQAIAEANRTAFWRKADRFIVRQVAEQVDWIVYLSSF
jgi:hypothetical protein